MKILTVISILLLTMSAFASDQNDLNNSSMQNMMEEMQKLQICMAKIDQSQLEDVERLQIQFEEEVRSLCAEGKRNEAQKRAIKFATEMSNHPAIKEIRKCGKLVKGDIAKNILPDTDFNFKETNVHICDDMQDN